MFLYILKFSNINALKIGIAKTTNRIAEHSRTYKEFGLDLKNSYRIDAKNKNDIKILEKQLLQDYIDYKVDSNIFDKADGYTEIRRGEIIDLILNDIIHKKDKFINKKITITKGIKMTHGNIYSKVNELNKNKEKPIKRGYEIKIHKDLANAKYTMTALQHKLFLYAIARTDQEAPSFSLTRVKVSEFARYTDIDLKHSYRNVKAVAKIMEGLSISIKSKKDNVLTIKKYKVMNYFNYDNGEIIFQFHNQMKPLLLKLKKDYIVQESLVISFKSLYSMRLYDIFKSNSHNGSSFELSVKWIKDTLCLNDKYSRLTSLRRRVIEPAIKEINKYSNIKVVMHDKISDGRTVKSLLFKIKS